MKIVQECLVLVNMFFVVYSYLDFRCPYPSERRYRSKWFCNGLSTEKYTCLYNFITRTLEESCKFEPVLSEEGKEYQRSVFPYPVSCQNSQRYQPFPLGSNISSECVLLKSTCSDDGQYLFYRESSTNDHRCGCDFQKGFGFVHKVERLCDCDPSKEDCSCYMKQNTCISGYKLSSDYTCLYEDSNTHISKCPRKGPDRTGIDSQPLNLHPKNKFNDNMDRGARISKKVATVLTVICIIYVISMLSFLVTNRLPECLIQEISPPFNLKAIQEGRFLKLAWSETSIRTQAFKIYYTHNDNWNDHQQEMVVVDKLHYNFSKLLPSKTYRFKVAACLKNIVESKCSEEETFVTGLPVQPRYFNAYQRSNSVLLVWAAPVDTLIQIDNYFIRLTTNNWETCHEKILPCHIHEYVIQNVEQDVLYRFEIVSVSNKVCSIPLNQIYLTRHDYRAELKFEVECQKRLRDTLNDVKTLQGLRSVPGSVIVLAKEDCQTASYTGTRQKEFQPMYMSGIKPELGLDLHSVNVLAEEDCETGSFSHISEKFQPMPLPEIYVTDTVNKAEEEDSKTDAYYSAAGNASLLEIESEVRFKRSLQRCRSNSLPSLRSTKKDIKGEQDWFYKLNITCDNYSLHLINDFNIPRKFKALSVTVQYKAQTNLTTEYSTNKESTTAFERIYQQTICRTNNILPMSDCIKQNLDLAVRFLLARHIGPTELIEFLYESLKENRNAISKAIGWTITRQFYKDIPTKVVNSVIDIWPGFRCLCEKHCRKDSSRICSTETVIIVEVDLFLNSIPDAFYEIPIQQSYPEMKREHKKVQCHEEKTDVSSLNMDITIQTPVSISGEIAEILFKQHSKMTMIHVHPSRRMSIQLWAQIKGVIPMGENHFPKTINGLDTCIAEGHVRFMAKIQIGDTIRVPGSAGTLGGFVQMHGCNAFLTCAHVVHDKNKLIAGNKRELHRSKTKVFCLDKNNPNSNIESGYVVNEAFDFNNAKGTSVDAAVVILDEDKVKFDEKDILNKGSSGPISTDFLGMNGPYLNDNYITPKTESGTVAAKYVGITSGYVESNVTFEDYDKNDEKFKTDQHGLCLYFKDLSEHLKYIESECPRPADTHFEVHFQQCVVSKLQEVITSGKHYFRCYKQLLFTDFLFKPGDSGTCIYVVEDKSVVRSDNQPNPTGCLAMAIASFYDRNEGRNKCIATPMQAILKKLGLI